MPWFLKKPIKVYAEQYKGPICVAKDDPLPPVPDGVRWKSLDMTFDRYPYVKTAQGQEVVIGPEEWVVTESNGSGHYPCSPELHPTLFDPIAD